MVEWYHSVYDRARKIEGAAQRVQEDTIKFSRIMESLGTSLIEAIMILVCLLYTSPSPRDATLARMPSSA